MDTKKIVLALAIVVIIAIGAKVLIGMRAKGSGGKDSGSGGDLQVINT